MFLTPEQTGGLLIFALRQSNRYLAIKGRWDASQFCAFHIEQLAQALSAPARVLAGGPACAYTVDRQAGLEAVAGETWQEHASLILLACHDGKLFEWLDTIGGL